MHSGAAGRAAVAMGFMIRRFPGRVLREIKPYLARA
jgi:hypothetical protein